MRPDPYDFLGLDDRLSDEERLLRDTVRRFVDEQWLPVVADHFEAGTFPTELIPRVGELGLFGMHLDGYGCAGASALAYGIACRELERGDSGLPTGTPGSSCRPTSRHRGAAHRAEALAARVGDR